jgi:4-hydroxy-tetrahydrodipicolinate synthase
MSQQGGKQGGFSGVLAPAITSFRRDLSVDIERSTQHVRWLLDNGCTGLAVFGTNSEANSLSVEERERLLESFIRNGVDPRRLMPGTGCCSLSDSVRLTAHAVKAGCGGVLMLPPFYYKGVSDDGLFRNFAEVIERVADARLRLYLYHIPPVAQVPIPLALIERLLKAYPTTLAGMKDSSGDWNYSKSVLDAFAANGFEFFAGSEVFLLANMRNGGKGCISATANVNPAAIRRLYEEWQSPEADRMQEALNATRAAVQKFPMISALKATVAHYANDPDWIHVRPPLVDLPPDKCQALIAGFETLGFSMKGLALGM